MLFAAMIPFCEAESIGLKVDQDAELIDQTIYSDTACGPTALLSALKFGSKSHQLAYAGLTGSDDSTKLRFVIERYFDQKSSVFERQKRFTKAGGVAHVDLLAAYQDLAGDYELAKPQGKEWIRREGKPSVDFVRETHDKLRFSLLQEVAPILALRSQIARYDPETSSWNWRKMADHFVVVTAVPDTLRTEAHGFAIEYIDPNGGKQASGFIHAERRQRFAGYQGTAAMGRWLDGNRFLLVTAPNSYSLIDGERANWHDRTLITLSYIISL
ncbi:MAG: hypothetical protein AAGH89_18590 [Verrucomicrobiota bacterium]